MTDLIKQQIENPATIELFVKLFSAVHKVDAEAAKNMYELEKFQFLKELIEKQIPSDITPISAMGVFLDVTGNGLSFASTAKHVYVMHRSVKTTTGYEKRLVFQTQPDGKIFQAQRAGSINYVTKPVIVYEGDEFALQTNEQGLQIIRHIAAMPRKSQKIIAGYVYVVYPNGNREPFWMDMNNIQRLQAYSIRNNRTESGNALYTSNNGQIDPGFFGSKLINFALKNVRKSIIPSAYQVEDELPQVPSDTQFEAVMDVQPVQSGVNAASAQMPQNYNELNPELPF